MMEKLGFTQFAYDYRAEHIPSFDAEMEALKRHHIRLLAWWFPTDLNAEARGILDVLRRHQLHAQLWITGGGGPTRTPEEQKARVEAEVRRIRPIAEAAGAIGCTVALYNHGNWFGEPENQLEIIEKLGMTNVGIVYNLHHGHDHLDRFPALLKRMRPHLMALNLNGMTRNGDRQGRKIMPIGQGDLDLALLRHIEASGWRGPVGILNHTDEDAEARLMDNLDGLEWLLKRLRGAPAGPAPVPRSWKDPGKPQALLAPALDPRFGSALKGSLLAQGRPEYARRPLTIECRARLNSAAGFNILLANQVKASAEHWELYSYAGSGVLSLYQPGRGGEVKSTAAICDGRWHRLGAVLEDARVRLFVDGVLVADARSSPVQGDAIAGDFAIGQLVEGGLFCDGLIDDVRVSKGVREIPPTQDLPLAKDAQTLGLWNFDADGKPQAQSVPERDPWAVEDAAARDRLPEYQIIPPALPSEWTPSQGLSSVSSRTNWHRSLGDATSSRFSALNQIDRSNVTRLEVAWTYHSKDGRGNIQCNPIVVGHRMIAPTVGHRIVAVDASNGAELWSFRPEVPAQGQRLEDLPARRGLLYWPGHAKASGRILFACGNWIYALDVETGRPVASFGSQGRVSLPAGGTAVGAVAKGVLVVPGFAQDVFGYDVITGRLLWTFHTVPRAGEEGFETWDGVEGGANCWGGMAMDEGRGIAYVSTGSPKPNFTGSRHHGDNLFSNCVLALDVLTGKKLWHFQEIRHDIWDLDIPAPPNLVTVTRDGRSFDAVAQVTKLGNTLLLDRLSGKPLFPFRMRRAPTSRLPGEWTSPYQPALELPQPFARQEFGVNEITDRNEEAHGYIRQRVAGANFGWFRPFDEGKPTVLFGIHGGAEWTGAAFDPLANRLFVSANELPWMVTVFPEDPEPPLPAGAPTRGHQIYQQTCAACHGPDRVGVGTAPPLRGLRLRMKDAEVAALLKTGRNLMPAAPPMPEADLHALLDFLFVRDRVNGVAPGRPARPAYTHNGYPKLLDAEGYPGCKPPWGTLNCLDLNTGKIAWKVALGEYPELTAQGMAKTGTENFGGPMVTAGGLVFCAGTRDLKIRAFDASSGAELWSHRLPWGGFATPATYSVNGRQFVVVAATGGGKLGGETGDAYVAFSLPQQPTPSAR